MDCYGGKYKLLDSSETSGSSIPKKRTMMPTWLRRGLYVMGVMTGIFLLLASISCTWGYYWTKRQVERFTVTERLDLPVHMLPDSELEVIKDRAKLFWDELKAEKTPESDLVMTADEINGFIAHSDYLRGNAFVNVSENKVYMDLSLPAHPLPGGKGRYLVGSGYVDMALADSDKNGHTLVTTEIDTLTPVKDIDGPLLFGQFASYWRDDEDDDNAELVVNILKGKFLQWIVPQDYIDKKENLMDYVFEDDHDCEHREEWMRVMHGIQGITVENDQITIKPARRDSSSTVASTISATPSYSKTTSNKDNGGYRRRVLRATKLLF